MGILDIFKKKYSKVDKKAELDLDNIPEPVGWNAITAEFESAYPRQTNPINNPLDGMSVYDGGDYWHFITFGLTELYDLTY